jgi:hypothetical protein
MANNVVGELSDVVLKAFIYVLIIGSIVGTTAFTAITLVNVTALSETYGAAVTTFLGFLGTIAAIAAIVWLGTWIKKLFDKKSGIGNMTA